MDTSEYSTDTNVFFVNANLTATDNLSFYLEGVYTAAKASFDPFDMPLPEDIPEESNISPDHPGGTSKGAYDFTVISDYSDLDYTQLEGTFGVNYKLDEHASLYGSVNLMDLQDDQVYVYGDLTGSIITYAAGMRVGF
jgi:hypothetical protein